MTAHTSGAPTNSTKPSRSSTSLHSNLARQHADSKSTEQRAALSSSNPLNREIGFGFASTKHAKAIQQSNRSSKSRVVLARHFMNWPSNLSSPQSPVPKNAIGRLSTSCLFRKHYFARRVTFKSEKALGVGCQQSIGMDFTHSQDVLKPLLGCPVPLSSLRLSSHCKLFPNRLIKKCPYLFASSAPVHASRLASPDR